VPSEAHQASRRAANGSAAIGIGDALDQAHPKGCALWMHVPFETEYLDIK
jgi:hypothetical protein